MERDKRRFGTAKSTNKIFNVHDSKITDVRVVVAEPQMSSKCISDSTARSKRHTA